MFIGFIYSFGCINYVTIKNLKAKNLLYLISLKILNEFQPLRDVAHFSNPYVALPIEILVKLYLPWFKKTMGIFVHQM